MHDELVDSGDPTLEFAAGLLDYHDRERKPVWWAFLNRIELSDEELRRCPRVDWAPRANHVLKTDKQSLRHRFTYPPQERGLVFVRGHSTPRHAGMRARSWSLTGRLALAVSSIQRSVRPSG